MKHKKLFRSVTALLAALVLSTTRIGSNQFCSFRLNTDLKFCRNFKKMFTDDGLWDLRDGI